MEGTPADNIWFDGMAGSVLGVWVAHGEGRLFCPESATEEFIAEKNLAPIRYVDDEGKPTEVYPLNPNGSPGGIASLCSPNGRHLAMMPHPERCFTGWQQPWSLPEWKDEKEGPWLQMFQNIRNWCHYAEKQKKLIKLSPLLRLQNSTILCAASICACVRPRFFDE